MRHLRAYFRAQGKHRAVLGLSGGVDSAVVACLAAKALGPKNVFAFHLPYWRNRADERDAHQLALQLGIHFSLVGIQPISDAFIGRVVAKDVVARGNFMARSRMALLYHFAREKKALVLGTGNRTEFLAGYFTKFGDGAADYFPIAPLYKTQVWELARKLGVPASIVEKAPSAGFWKGQTDEGELGLSYAELDRILVAAVDRKRPRKRLEQEFGKKKVALVLERVQANAHKRLPAGRPSR